MLVIIESSDSKYNTQQMNWEILPLPFPLQVLFFFLEEPALAHQTVMQCAELIPTVIENLHFSLLEVLVWIILQ